MFLKKKNSLCHVILLKGNGMLSCYECVVVRPAVRVQIELFSRLRLEVMYMRRPVNWNFESNLQIHTSAAWNLLIRPFFW